MKWHLYENKNTNGQIVAGMSKFVARMEQENMS